MPLWLVAIIIVVLCIAALQAGTLLRRRMMKGDAAEWEPNDYVIGAIFGLLAFMLAITFSISIERFDARRMLVNDEADAIRTTYITAALLDQPYGSNIRAALRTYATTRIAPKGYWAATDSDTLKRSRALRDRALAAVQAGAFPVRDTDLGASLIQAGTELQNIGARREIVGRAHIPSRIIDVLVLYTLVSAAVLGFVTGEPKSRARFTSILLLALYSCAMILIVDLDFPQIGSIRVPQAPMEELVRWMNQS